MEAHNTCFSTPGMSLVAGASLSVRQQSRQPLQSLLAISASSFCSLMLLCHPHTLLIMVKYMDRVHHAPILFKAISSCGSGLPGRERGHEQRS